MYIWYFFNLDRFCAVNPKPVACSDFAPIIWKAESRNATRATATSCPRKNDSLQRRRKKRLKKRPEKCSEEREHLVFMQRILVTIATSIIHVLCLPISLFKCLSYICICPSFRLSVFQCYFCLRKHECWCCRFYSIQKKFKIFFL